MGLFEDILGGVEKPSQTPDLNITFDVWANKQPIFQKIPKDVEAKLKLKVSDLRRIAAAAYAAGFYRAQL